MDSYDGVCFPWFVFFGILDEISSKGVADYISEIEKTYMKYIMNENIGGILVNKVFGEKTKLIGVFETIYKERRGYADNSSQIVILDINRTAALSFCPKQ